MMSNLSDFAKEVSMTIVGLLGGSLSGYIFGKKQYQKQVESIAIETAERAINLYKKSLDDLEIRFDSKIQKLENELHECKKEMLNKLS